MQIMAMHIVTAYNKTAKNKLDLGTVLSKILMHDAEESFMNDCRNDCKNYSAEYREAYEKVSKEILEKKIGKELAEINTNAKDNTPEGFLVRLLDIYELILFCRSDVKLGNGSDHICNILHNADEIVHKIEEDLGKNNNFDKEYKDLIKDLCNEASL